jgi:hypothetical protein
MATPLEPIFRKRVADAVNTLLRDQVNPWLNIADTGPFTIKGFQGTLISHDGRRFVGGPQASFWQDYIEPFLEKVIDAEISAAASAAEHRGLDLNEVLEEVEDHLQAGIKRIYHEMARIDQALVRLDIPSAPMRKIDGYVDYMVAYLAERIRAERTLWGSATKLEIWHARNRFWAWAISTIIAVLALILGLIGALK